MLKCIYDEGGIDMALIKCPECGKEVSELAVSCPNCGFTINKSNEQTISYIGSENIEGDVNKKNVKKRYHLWIAILIIVGIIGIFFFLRKNANKGYWDDNQWGTTYSEIMKKYGDDASESFLKDGDISLFVQNELDIEGLNGTVNLGFNKSGKLSSVLLMYSNDSTMSDQEIVKLLKEHLSEFYGNANEDKNGYSWSTDESIIKLRSYSSASSGIYVEYEAIREDDNNNIELGNSGLVEAVESMVTELGVKYDESKHGSWDLPIHEAEIIVAGGQSLIGDIKFDAGYSAKRGMTVDYITDAQWYLSNQNYFSKLYDVFVEVYGEPDEKHTETSVTWVFDDYEILLQYNWNVSSTFFSISIIE